MVFVPVAAFHCLSAAFARDVVAVHLRLLAKEQCHDFYAVGFGYAFCRAYGNACGAMLVGGVFFFFDATCGAHVGNTQPEGLAQSFQTGGDFFNMSHNLFLF